MQFNLWNERPDFVSRWQWFVACLVGLAGELADYAFVLEQVPKVYASLTNGKFSNPNHRAETIISTADDYMQDCIAQAIKDECEACDYKVESNPPDAVSTKRTSAEIAKPPEYQPPPDWAESQEGVVGE